MRNRTVLIALIGMAAAGFAAGLLVESRILRVQAQSMAISAFPAVPGQKGGEDITGPYEPVADWPKPMSASLPGHENWTWGAVEGIFAESPNRVFIAERGELPIVKRPPQTPVPQFGPSLSFPTAEVPFRNASQGPVAALPGGGAPGDLPENADKNWHGKKGVDARWEHNLVVVNAEGKITEDWTKWDNFFERPHAVYINPYDPEKSVWVVDDFKEAIFKFSHDGKKLLQTLGTPGPMPARTARISIARRFSPGSRTARYLSPTDTTARAWRNSIRMGNSCWPGAKKGLRRMRRAPAILMSCTELQPIR